MQVQLRRIEELAPHIHTYWFEPERAYEYIAGQFVELKFLPAGGGRVLKRWFTLSSSPTEDLLAVTTRINSQTASDFKRRLQRLQPGDKLHVSEPMGDFVLPKDRKLPLLFISGGMGITPMRSMLKWLQDQHENRDITGLYFFRLNQEVLFRPLLEQNSSAAIRTAEAEQQPLTQLITFNAINAACPDMDKRLVYIAGPEPMTENLVQQFTRHGFPPHHLVTDYFPGYDFS